MVVVVVERVAVDVLVVTIHNVISPPQHCHHSRIRTSMMRPSPLHHSLKEFVTETGFFGATERLLIL